LIFLILFGLGLRNVVTKEKNIKKEETQHGLVFKKNSENPQTPENKAQEKEETKSSQSFLIVKITDGSLEVNIRAKPTIYSEKIGTAKEGERFVFKEKAEGWYKIQMKEGLEGFIAAKYAVEENEK
jgi:uncharacterized protein YgiM (DUF1202 family)